MLHLMGWDGHRPSLSSPLQACSLEDIEGRGWEGCFSVEHIGKIAMKNGILEDSHSQNHI